MKSDRFKGAPTPEEIAENFDLSEESLPPIENNALVKTFLPTEYPIEVYTKSKKVEEAYVRVLIGVCEEDLKGTYILILSNNKIYVTDSITSKRVMYDEELSVGDIVALTTASKLHTTQIKTITEELNSLKSKVACSRKLIGACEYLVFNDIDLKYLHPKDFELCFHVGKNRWLYYSDAMASWVLLPKGWQKLTKVEREEPEIYSTYEKEVGEAVGYLDTKNVYQFDGKTWNKIAEPTDEIGDEYLVQYIHTNENTSKGSLIYTTTGWKYLN